MRNRDYGYCGLIFGRIILELCVFRIWKHSRDIGMSALSGNVGDPGTRGYKDPAQYLNHHLSEDSQRSGRFAFFYCIILYWYINPSNYVDMHQDLSGLFLSNRILREIWKAGVQ